ncbi:hypothetical protein CsSME_00016793 [Camellia sinensis var. sinensis]
MSSAPPPLVAVLALLFVTPVIGWRPWPNQKINSSDLQFGGSKKFEGSSEFVHMKYHMGPVLTANITVHTVWYGTWQSRQQRIIREFINSISAPDSKHPSVSGWWQTVQLYTDQTGSNISRVVRLGEEKNDRFYSHGKSPTQIQQVVPASRL